MKNKIIEYIENDEIIDLCMFLSANYNSITKKQLMGLLSSLLYISVGELDDYDKQALVNDIDSYF